MKEPMKDIAKQFDLPERKSKIDTLLKFQEVKPRYCFCQSTDISGFMICCEKCNEWYHGHCIGLAEEDTKLMKKWYCSVCIKNFGLQVIYSLPKRNIFSQKSKMSNSRHRDNTKNKTDLLKLQDFQCGKCSNCLQNFDCGNKDYFIKSNCTNKYEFKSTNRGKPITILQGNFGSKQCVVPKCQNLAREQSKYCSDDCGLTFSKTRLLSILPSQVMERRQNPSIADQLDEARLQKVREQKQLATDKLKSLDKKEKKLLQLIAKAKQTVIMEGSKLSDDGSKIYCISCGLEIPLRSANRHMDICFKKFESQSAVVASTKTTNCEIFCEYYDEGKNTYCKRLRYICPDHHKQKKGEDTEVCGCPIIELVSTSSFSETEKYCQQKKKLCDHHYNWEVRELSEIDLQRLHQWEKIQRLNEEEIVIKNQIINRTGALGILLHSTEPADCSM